MSKANPLSPPARTRRRRGSHLEGRTGQGFRPGHWIQDPGRNHAESTCFQSSKQVVHENVGEFFEVSRIFIRKEEARQRQRTSTGGAHPQLREVLPEADLGRSRDLAARDMEVSGSSVEHVLRVKEAGGYLPTGRTVMTQPEPRYAQISAFQRRETTK